MGSCSSRLSSNAALPDGGPRGTKKTQHIQYRCAPQRTPQGKLSTLRGTQRNARTSMIRRLQVHEGFSLGTKKTRIDFNIMFSLIPTCLLHIEVRFLCWVSGRGWECACDPRGRRYRAHFFRVYFVPRGLPFKPFRCSQIWFQLAASENRTVAPICYLLTACCNNSSATFPEDRGCFGTLPVGYCSRTLIQLCPGVALPRRTRIACRSVSHLAQPDAPPGPPCGRSVVRSRCRWSRSCWARTAGRGGAGAAGRALAGRGGAGA